MNDARMTRAAVDLTSHQNKLSLVTIQDRRVKKLHEASPKIYKKSPKKFNNFWIEKKLKLKLCKDICDIRLHSGMIS